MRVSAHGFVCAHAQVCQHLFYTAANEVARWQWRNAGIGLWSLRRRAIVLLYSQMLLDEQARQQHCAPEALNAHFNNHFERTADSKPSKGSMLLYTLYLISCLLIALTSFR